MADYKVERPNPELLQQASSGWIAVFARHRTAPNILMILLIGLGLWASSKIPTQFFPEVSNDSLTVSESWSGASAEDVDQAIIQIVEPSVRFLEGADEVSTSAQEGRAVIQIDYSSGTDMSEAKSELDAGISLITSSLPDDANDPRIRRAPFRDFVSNILISGPYERQALLEFAEEIRDGLLSRGLLQVDIIGTYRPEIRIEPDPQALQRLDLSLADLSRLIESRSQNTPAGEVNQGARLVRTLGQASRARDYRDFEIKSLPDGTTIRLSEIAKVYELNAADAVEAYRNGNPAIELSVKRGKGGDSLKQQRIVEAYTDEILPTLPRDLNLEIYNVRADIIKARLALLVENGAAGLLIVLVLLFLFLNWRTAFWVAAGIPISLAATLGFMYVTGQSINMISLFALILTLGIIVDDAIVVGEHADALHRSGFKASDSAVLGAQRMAAPVFSAGLTTIIAFGAILVIGGRFGTFMQAIPLAVIAVLAASLLECFFILPGHMRHALQAQSARSSLSSLLDWVFTPIRRLVDTLFDFFRFWVFRPAIKFALICRYPVLALTIAGMLIAIASVGARKVPFRFFVAPEFNSINANITMIKGATRADTLQQLEYMQAALEQTLADLAEPGDEKAITMALAKVGGRVGRSRGASANQDTDLIGGFTIQLSEQDQRSFTTFAFSEAWQDSMQKHPLLESISLRGFRGGPRGDDVDVRLNGENLENLKVASSELLQYLETVPGVSGQEDDLPYGKTEFQLRLTSKGKALGFNATSLGNELRAALEGLVVERFARDNREVTVRLKLPDTALDAGFLFNTYLRSSSGVFVPLTELVTLEETQGFGLIRRFDGQRQVAVTADIDSDQTSVEHVQVELENGILQDLQAKYDLTYSLEGRAKQQAQFMQDAMLGLGAALLGIYLTLAWVFSSFVRPLVVLLVVPLGFIGMVYGHYANDMPLSIFSIIGFIGLTGIIVNDTIVLVTTVDRRVKSQAFRSAVVDGTTDRLRAVLLTSATTIGGLMPLLYETSVQAKFLIPTVITMIYGLGFGTLMVLLVVPALLAVEQDIKSALRSFSRLIRHFILPKRSPQTAA